MKRIHLDTDLGGDIDDLCALAMLLRWSGDVEITGITTVAEANGRRAGYVRYVLGLEGRSEIPVAAGADVAQGYYRYPQLGYPAEERYWPEPVAPSPNAAQEAIRLLQRSIEQGATIVAIGPYTNLYLLDRQRPGILAQADLILMGGYVYPVRAGFPQWGNDADWNIQVDVRSAQHVLSHSKPTLVPLTVTVETALRRAYLAKLRRAGALGQLIVRQAEAFALDEQMETRFGQTCTALPQDIINFQHDSLACAIALGWEDGVEVEELPLLVQEQDGWLTERIHPAGAPTRIVTRIDGPRFNEFWLGQVANRTGRFLPSQE
jgi:purine nucleosidase